MVNTPVLLLGLGHAFSSRRMFEKRMHKDRREQLVVVRGKTRANLKMRHVSSQCTDPLYDVLYKTIMYCTTYLRYS
jgi:hypothetical protein